MNFKNKNLIIFDLDGTLIDSVPDLALSVNYTLESIGKKNFSEDIIRKWVGNGAATLVKRALSGDVNMDESIDNMLFEKTLDIFLNYYAKNLTVSTQLYPNVKETLLSLKNKGYILVIVTNKPYAFIEPILKYFDLIELFEYYIGGDSLSEKKPSALPLLHICEKFNIEVKSTLIVGDSKNDIISANNAFMNSIAVSYGYNYDEDISIYKPTYTVDNFAKIDNLL